MELQELIGSHPGDQKLLERYYDLLAKGIVTVGCATAPEIVVIQGKYLGSDVLRYITERIRPYFQRMCFRNCGSTRIPPAPCRA